MTTEQVSLAFKDFEKVGWGKQARHYDTFIGQTTKQATETLLDAVGAKPGTILLDVATGPGYVAAEATKRGADATGIDISGRPHRSRTASAGSRLHPGQLPSKAGNPHISCKSLSFRPAR